MRGHCRSPRFLHFALVMHANRLIPTSFVGTATSIRALADDLIMDVTEVLNVSGDSPLNLTTTVAVSGHPQESDPGIAKLNPA